jgi:hypothetical protein
MSNRNGQITDKLDRDHRRIFVGLARENSIAPSRQRARHLWQRKAKGARIGHAGENCFAEATMILTKEATE